MPWGWLADILVFLCSFQDRDNGLPSLPCSEHQPSATAGEWTSCPQLPYTTTARDITARLRSCLQLALAGLLLWPLHREWVGSFEVLKPFLLPFSTCNCLVKLSPWTVLGAWSNFLCIFFCFHTKFKACNSPKKKQPTSGAKEKYSQASSMGPPRHNSCPSFGPSNWAQSGVNHTSVLTPPFIALGAISQTIAWFTRPHSFSGAHSSPPPHYILYFHHSQVCSVSFYHPRPWNIPELQYCSYNFCSPFSWPTSTHSFGVTTFPNGPPQHQLKHAPHHGSRGTLSQIYFWLSSVLLVCTLCLIPCCILTAEHRRAHGKSWINIW